MITTQRRHAAIPNPYYEVVVAPPTGSGLTHVRVSEPTCDVCGGRIASWRSKAGIRWRHVAK